MMPAGTDLEAQCTVRADGRIQVAHRNDSMIETANHYQLLSEGRKHFVGHALKLPALVIANQAQRNRGRAGVNKGPQALDAVPGRANGDPVLQVGTRIVHRIVRIQELLALLKCRLAILIHVDVIVQAGLEFGAEVASLLLGVAPDGRQVVGEGLWRVAGGHPAITVLRNASEGALGHLGVLRSRVGCDPDRDGLLHRARQHADIIEAIVLPLVAGVLL